MKFGAIGRIVLVTVLIIASGIAVWELNRLPLNRLAALLGVTITVSDGSVTATPETSEAVDVPISTRSVVAIQTFSRSQLVRSGSGLVASSDGLIVTTSAVAPYGSGSYVYQVSLADGNVLRAHGVRWGSGLVLLKVDASQLDAAFFGSVDSTSGERVTVRGAFVELSQYIPVVLDGTIPYVAANESLSLSTDRTFLGRIQGAGVFGEDGVLLGLVRSVSASVARIISSSDIDVFITAYLETVHQAPIL